MVEAGGILNKEQQGRKRKSVIWTRISLVVIFLIFALTWLSTCDFSWKRYYDKEYRFSLLLPRSWAIKTGAYGTAMLAIEPRNSPQDNYSENVNVGVINLPKPTTLAAFFIMNRDALLSKIISPDFSEGDILAGLRPGKWLSFETYAKKVKIKVVSTIFMHGSQAYIITCSSAAEKYPEYEPVFMKIVKSFRIR
ncbi:MAG: hypothetical protein PHF11_02155 [Candidatus Omnitrophica bacterium]|nr:hypothetical protein [Candidatus Omnitrophota bacterium]